MSAGRVWRVAAAVLLAGALGQLSGPGCATYDIERDEPCRQAGFSIASRTFACTGDTTLANDRYRRFAGAYRCVAAEATAEAFSCSNALGDRTCDQVLVHGDDLGAWLGTAPACRAILVQADGAPIPNRGLPDGSLDADPGCARIVEAAALARAACADAASADFGATRQDALTKLDAAYACTTPDFATLPPELPRDPEVLLQRCLDGVRDAAAAADPTACAQGSTAFYETITSGCVPGFLGARR